MQLKETAKYSRTNPSEIETKYASIEDTPKRTIRNCMIKKNLTDPTTLKKPEFLVIILLKIYFIV